MDKVIVIRHSDNVKHFTEQSERFASGLIVNADGSDHKWTAQQIEQKLKEFNINIPDTSTIYDVTYTANMAYADFFPTILDESKCVKYAANVANDPDGYEGIQFNRWLADMNAKHINVQKYI